MQRDILIIGCGIFGAAIAWAMGRRGLGHRVLIVDRQTPASGATSQAAGLGHAGAIRPGPAGAGG